MSFTTYFKIIKIDEKLLPFIFIIYYKINKKKISFYYKLRFDFKVRILDFQYFYV